MKRFLIASRDESIAHYPPRIVVAETADAALQRFLKVVNSKDEVFRDGVLDLCINMSFAEKFYLSSEQEHKRFNETGSSGTEPEIVKSRVMAYFSSRPDIGEKYLKYMETEDKSLITEDVFEFIAIHEEPEVHGLMALDLDTIEVVA